MSVCFILCYCIFVSSNSFKCILYMRIFIICTNYIRTTTIAVIITTFCLLYLHALIRCLSIRVTYKEFRTETFFYLIYGVKQFSFRCTFSFIYVYIHIFFHLFLCIYIYIHFPIYFCVYIYNFFRFIFMCIYTFFPVY